MILSCARVQCIVDNLQAFMQTMHLATPFHDHWQYLVFNNGRFEIGEKLNGHY